jgi:dipeptidase E
VGAQLTLGGIAGARVFRRGHEPAELAPGTDVSWLLELQPRFDVGL